jgi:arylsulfatase A-like enzyme
MAGGPIREGVRLEEAHIYDLFPTVLHLLGLPVPETADGRVLEEALEPGFRAAAPIARVASYDALLPAFLPTGERGGEGEARRREEEIEKLKALGYVR